MIWERSQELYASIPYKCKVGQSNDLEHDGMTNPETEMSKWK